MKCNTKCYELMNDIIKNKVVQLDKLGFVKRKGVFEDREEKYLKKK